MRITPLLLAAIAGVGLTPSTGRSAPEAPRLGFPLGCVIGKSCEVQHYVDRDPGPGVRDYQCRLESYQSHSGIDIRLLDMAQQRRGVAVLAAAPGRVARLRDGVADISVRAPGAPPLNGQDCGNAVVIDHGGGWETQYCHLAKGSVAVKVGEVVAAGQPIAKVGLSGNTEFPHLHLTVRRGGKTVDPFAPDMSDPASCRPQSGLWTTSAAQRMPYKPAVALNAGFVGAPVTMDAVEAGDLAAPTRGSAYLLAYVRAISLEAGDQIEFTLSAPNGQVLARGGGPPIDRHKAQYLIYVGKKQPAGGWPPGTYSARYRVLRGPAAVVDSQFRITL